MRKSKKVWLNYKDKIDLKEPVALVGSSGLRSVGKITIDYLVEKMHPRLFAELYSYGFPSIYYGPSYLCAPSGVGVKRLEDGGVELPRIEFFALEKQNQNIIITRGYQANSAFDQYMCADKVTDLFEELNVKKVISFGAQVIEEGLRCCATDFRLLEEMHKYGVEKTNVDRFIGFSGLVVAMAREKGIEGVCLFANTSQNLLNPEYPDFNAAKELLEKVSEILNIQVDTSDLEEKRGGVVKERREKEKEREELIGYE